MACFRAKYGFFLFCLVIHKSRVYRSRDICKNWNAGYSLFVALESSSYSLHALASLVRCARLNKKSPLRERVGEWAYSQAGASVHWLVASVHGLPEIFVQY